MFTAAAPERASAETTVYRSAVVDERGLALWAGTESDFGVGVDVVGRPWTVRSTTSMTTLPIDGVRRPTFQQVELLRPLFSVNSASVAGGGGIRQEWDGSPVLIGRVLAGADVAGGRLQGSFVLEHAMTSGIRRDAADVVTSVGWSHRIGNRIAIGVEGIGQDLEGFWDPTEAEGGAKLLVGPSLHVRSRSGHWSASATAGPVLRSQSTTSPDLPGPMHPTPAATTDSSRPRTGCLRPARSIRSTGNANDGRHKEVSDMTKRTRRLAVRVLIAGLVLPIGVAAKVAISFVGAQPDGSVLLPNGQTITPVGTQIEVNDRPLAIAISPDGAQAAVATASNFAPRALQIIDLASQSVAQTLPIGNSFVGLAYAPGGQTLYVGGGADNDVKIFTRNGGTGLWAPSAPVSIPSSSPSGLSLSPAGDKLYVALNRSNALGIIDTSSRAVVQVATGAFPYTHGHDGGRPESVCQQLGRPAARGRGRDRRLEPGGGRPRDRHREQRDDLRLRHDGPTGREADPGRPASVRHVAQSRRQPSVRDQLEQRFGVRHRHRAGYGRRTPSRCA